jgi:hypothetical protein
MTGCGVNVAISRRRVLLQDSEFFVARALLDRGDPLGESVSFLLARKAREGTITG